MMQFNPLSLPEHTLIDKAAALLTHYQLPAAPVVDAGHRPVGLVTDSACESWREFTLRSAEDTYAPHRDYATVEEILHPVIELVDHDASEDEVLEVMERSYVGYVYVVNDDGQLIGSISPGDVLRHRFTPLERSVAGGCC